VISTVDRQEAILAALRECPLYFILDESLLDAHDPLEQARAVTAAGVRMLQLRIKTWPAADVLALAHQLKPILAESQCIFIVNDSPEIAQAAGADGVHLGAEDGAVADVRAAYPTLMVGATARTPEPAWAAEVAGADYVGCGSVYRSATKTGLPVIGIDGLAAVNRYISIPVVGIGGINLDNAATVLQTEVAGICAIEPFRSGDPADVVRQFTDLRRQLREQEADVAPQD
jgi:thiamine-phosphate pyrophosphorylase